MAIALHFLFSLLLTRIAVLVVERNWCSQDTFHVGAQVELGVIYVAVELHVIFSENIVERKEVHNEQKGNKR